MFEQLITVIETPAWYSHDWTARLIARDERASFYLSCWRLPAVIGRKRHQQWDDYQATNWKCEIATQQAQEWLEMLRWQNIPIAPVLPTEDERDGSLYQFVFEDNNRRIQLDWPGEIPGGWEPIWTITNALLERMRDSAPDELRPVPKR